MRSLSASSQPASDNISILLQNSHVLRQEQICAVQYALADHENLLMLKNFDGELIQRINVSLDSLFSFIRLLIV